MENDQSQITVTQFRDQPDPMWTGAARVRVNYNARKREYESWLAGTWTSDADEDEDEINPE